MESLSSPEQWLPIVFAALMGIAILAYVILDGYDLGVGMLLARASEEEKDKMIASIGPFWDANETWLVLGVGLLLVAFPVAHGAILTALYLPAALLLFGLIFRGVAFDFRAKAQAAYKHHWDRLFFAGSLLASLSQGFMLGFYIIGFEYSLLNLAFSLLTAVGVAAGYCLLGAGWLIMKADGDLQRKAIRSARVSLWLTALGMGLVSVATPLVSERIFDKWFSFPNIILLAPIPLASAAIVLVMDFVLRKLPRPADRWCWVPFAGAVSLFLLGFHGLAYSFFPYILPDKMTIWQAASAPEALMIILAGTAFVLPCIIGYTIFAYKVFWGKVQELRYY
jgi:cytochrome d ubiquinol oxidase subunit II